MILSIGMCFALSGKPGETAGGIVNEVGSWLIKYLCSPLIERDVLFIDSSRGIFSPLPHFLSFLFFFFSLCFYSLRTIPFLCSFRNVPRLFNSCLVSGSHDNAHLPCQALLSKLIQPLSSRLGWSEKGAGDCRVS